MAVLANTTLLFSKAREKEHSTTRKFVQVTFLSLGGALSLGSADRLKENCGTSPLRHSNRGQPECFLAPDDSRNSEIGSVIGHFAL